MFNLGDITKENKKEHNKKWPCIPDHPYRILIIGGSGSGKTNAILNLIKQQDDIDKNYLYAKDLSEPIYQFLIKKRENVGKKIFKWSKSIYWGFKYNWWLLMKILMITTQQEKEKIYCVWWYDCRCYK